MHSEGDPDCPCMNCLMGEQEQFPHVWEPFGNGLKCEWCGMTATNRAPVFGCVSGDDE